MPRNSLCYLPPIWVIRHFVGQEQNAKYLTATAHYMLFTSHKDKNNVDYDRDPATGLAICRDGRG
jgi:hypothetical protein